MELYVIATSKRNEYWNGKTYIFEGEIFPSLVSGMQKAKVYQSEKRANNGLEKLDAKLAYDYGFKIEKKIVEVS